MALSKLQAAITATKASCELQYVLLRASTIVGYFLKQIERTDSASVSDGMAKTVGKLLDDVATSAETIAFQFGKASTESVDATDIAVRTLNRAIAELATVADTVQKTIGKNISDSVTAIDDVNGASADDDQNIQFIKAISEVAATSENFQRVVDFIRATADEALAVDTPAKHYFKVLADAATVADSVTAQKFRLQTADDSGTTSDATVVGFGKSLAESASAIDAAFISFLQNLTDSVTAGDTKVLTVGKITADTATSTDAGTLLNQGYCGDYFAEDYVGQRITF